MLRVSALLLPSSVTEASRAAPITSAKPRGVGASSSVCTHAAYAADISTLHCCVPGRSSSSSKAENSNAWARYRAALCCDRAL